MENGKIDQIIDKHGAEAGALIKIMLDIQEDNGWLPQEALERIAERLAVPLARVQHAATFYKSFSIMPEGKHRVHICNGTSCHLRGSQKVIDAVQDVVDSDDSGRKFTVESVTCLGCCGSGPNIEIDGESHIEVTPGKAAEVLKRLD